tara:strand:- start:1252 stop:2271 length:1020 start_codon:yes stop_codon:yes gene_type:complete
MSPYRTSLDSLIDSPKTWLITGVAGFIGSNILETLLKFNQKVIGLDNLLTGHLSNLEDVQSVVSEDNWKNFSFVNGDICDIETCHDVTRDVDFVLHQAALGSVPRSIEDPFLTNKINIEGFLNILTASKDANVTSFTYAASSSTYGDHEALPKIENQIGKPLSPYAVSKYVNELYAHTFSVNYNFHSIGLRYFNVFGKRQDPNGAYAAVIPKWISAMIAGEEIFINGDGSTSRDFCYIENAVQANILAATLSQNIKNDVFNIAVGERTSLNELFVLLKEALKESGLDYIRDPIFRDFRSGDVLHSQASIKKAKNELSFNPSHNIKEGLAEAMPWYIKNS